MNHCVYQTDLVLIRSTEYSLAFPIRFHAFRTPHRSAKNLSPLEAPLSRATYSTHTIVGGAGNCEATDGFRWELWRLYKDPRSILQLFSDQTLIPLTSSHLFFFFL